MKEEVGRAKGEGSFFFLLPSCFVLLPSCFFLLFLVLLCPGADAAAAADRFKGRVLTDALQTLQAAGLRIVFSSEIITPALRVVSEPRSHAPLEILQEILKPHGLTVERGPGGVLIVVRSAVPDRGVQAKPAPSAPRPRESSTATSRSGYSEQVVVTADALDPARSGVGAEMALGRDELDHAAGVLTDDPLRGLKSLPRVVGTDDFRSEFSVRGSPRRHIGVVIDGVASSWLRHAAYGRRDLGSLTMFGTDVLEQASVQAGAYPQRNGDWLGAQLVLSLREGSRTRTRVRASMSGINGAIVAEGPLGRRQRGSWLLAARQSYLDWPVKKDNPLDPSVFGFSDALTKLVFDVRDNQKLTVTALAGRTGIDGPDGRAPWDLANGTNAAGMLTARWDGSWSRNLRFSQQMNIVSHRFRNTYQNGQAATHGVETDLSYRLDVIRPLFGGLLEAGGQARTTEASVPPAGIDTSASYRSVYMNVGWAPTRRVTIWPGLRVSTASVASRPALGRWMLGQWRIRDGWIINASAGVSHQFPELWWTSDNRFQTDLRPERAVHAEIALAHRPSQSIRWQASVFSRSERDVFASAETFVDAIDPVRRRNRLTGRASGVELLLERRATRGVSGWAGYSFGKSRYTDVPSGETFWADFDQRHALNVHGRYALPNQTTVSATFRAGSSFPVPGYLAVHEGKLFAGSRRNDVRLTPYARLDLSGERTFELAGRRVTIFGEFINVLNRRNMGAAEGTLNQQTGEALGFVGRLLPRMPVAGVRIDF